MTLFQTALIILAIIALLAVLACSGIGLLSAGILVRYSIWGGTEPIGWLFTILPPVFSGVYFPIEVIPERVRWVSKLLPQTYVLEAFRRALLNPSAPLLPSLAPLLAYTAIALVVGIVVFRCTIDFLREVPVAELL